MFTVRIATLKDLPGVIELEKRSGQRINEDLRALFNVNNPNEKYKFFKAEEDGKIVGYSCTKRQSQSPNV